MATRDLYDQDFLEWTVRNSGLLRAGRFGEADIEHIAEEIEDMGKSQRRELGSRLEVLLAHLLKWQFQPGGRNSSWESTIRIQRTKIAKLLRDMPSLTTTRRRGICRRLPDGGADRGGRDRAPEEHFSGGLSVFQ